MKLTKLILAVALGASEVSDPMMFIVTKVIAIILIIDLAQQQEDNK